MRKWLIIIGVLIGILGIVTFDSKFYYPKLPIETVSKKEVLTTLNGSAENMVKITEESDYHWFITRMEQGKAYGNIKNLISNNGWEFQKQEGSSYFFAKYDKTLIVSAEMWTGNRNCKSSG